MATRAGRSATVPIDPEFDRRMMAAALRLGRRNLGHTGSNPAVGCVIVRSAGEARQVVGRGWTAAGGRPHAEKQALAAAGSAAKGATVYVTLEPCAHDGNVPPCSQALAEAQVARVVVVDQHEGLADGEGVEGPEPVQPGARHVAVEEQERRGVPGTAHLADEGRAPAVELDPPAEGDCRSDPTVTAEDRARWLYTAITRAERGLVILD
jgi:pyrimidine deaminase RibD-like protein